MSSKFVALNFIENGFGSHVFLVCSASIELQLQRNRPEPDSLHNHA